MSLVAARGALDTYGFEAGVAIQRQWLGAAVVLAFLVLDDLQVLAAIGFYFGSVTAHCACVEVFILACSFQAVATEAVEAVESPIRMFPTVITVDFHCASVQLTLVMKVTVLLYLLLLHNE